MLKKYLDFAPNELKTFLFTGFVLSLILFFFKWRNTDFDLFIGLNWFILTLLIVYFLTAIARLLQKIVAHKKGYIATFKNSWKVTTITLGLSFFSFGFLPLLAPGRMELEPVERLRLGHNQQGIRWKDMSSVSLVAISTYVVFVVILKLLVISTEGIVFKHVLLISLLLAIFSAIPAPNYDGINVFANSRPIYLFMFAFIIIYAAMIWFTNMFILIIPLLAAIAITGFFLVKMDGQM